MKFESKARASIWKLSGLAMLSLASTVTLLAPATAQANHHGEEHTAEHQHAESAADHESDSHDSAASHHEGAEHEGAEINWATGIFIESDEYEPNLLIRPVGTPIPVAAGVINSFLLFLIIYLAARGPIAQGLKARRNRIMSSIDAATAMKAQAEADLANWQSKLDELESEIQSLREQARLDSESDRKRLVAEARARKEHLVREATRCIALEFEELGDSLRKELAKSAVAKARHVLNGTLQAADQTRLAELYLKEVHAHIAARSH